ncbi:MAG TPA: AI-2E family transporter [Chloroflexota bacterium]|nr:AI-2E family transporter [Chloroflexota bacterium]
MPHIRWNRVLIVQLAILAGVALVVIAWTIVHAVAHTLLLFGIAAVLAFALAPLVTRGEERGLPRLAAVGLVYLSLAVLLALSGALLARPFAIQATLLLDNLPAYLTGLQDTISGLDRWLAGFGLGGGIASLQSEASRQATGASTAFVGDLLRFLTQVASSALDTILVLVISFYLLLDGPRLRLAALRVVPPDHRGKLLFVEESLGRVLGGYLRGQLLMALTVAVVVGVVMQVLGMPYALVLGVLAGVFELVPMLGPILSALPALAVAVFQPFPTVLWVLIAFIAIQQFESNVLAPRITAHAVGLHPLGAIFALLAGFEIGGPLGAVFAVPVAGFLWVLITTVYRRTVGEPEPAPRAGWRLPRRGRSPDADPAAATSTGKERAMPGPPRPSHGPDLTAGE